MGGVGGEGASGRGPQRGAGEAGEAGEPRASRGRQRRAEGGQRGGRGCANDACDSRRGPHTGCRYQRRRRSAPWPPSPAWWRVRYRDAGLWFAAMGPIISRRPLPGPRRATMCVLSLPPPVLRSAPFPFPLRFLHPALHPACMRVTANPPPGESWRRRHRE